MIMRLIAIETPSGLLFKGGHAEVVSRLTDFETDNENCVVPAASLHWVFPRLVKAGHCIGILNPNKFIPKF